MTGMSIHQAYFTGAQIIERISELEKAIEDAWATFELDAEAYHAAVDDGLEVADTPMNPQRRLVGLFTERRELAKRLREMEGGRRW